MFDERNALEDVAARSQTSPPRRVIHDVDLGRNVAMNRSALHGVPRRRIRGPVRVQELLHHAARHTCDVFLEVDDGALPLAELQAGFVGHSQSVLLEDPERCPVNCEDFILRQDFDHRPEVLHGGERTVSSFIARCNPCLEVDD